MRDMNSLNDFERLCVPRWPCVSKAIGGDCFSFSFWSRDCLGAPGVELTGAFEDMAEGE
jgi:hypothetical protein